MQEIIEDVLALAREGQPIDETKPVRLSAVADRAWDSVDTPDAGLVVETDATFAADPERLLQAFENLFRNAVEHGGDDVRVRVGARADGDGFFVADDGPGIPPDERTEVFESGYTTREDGTGFGLAIVGEVVEAHGWSIAVGESDGGGARFDVTGIEQFEVARVQTGA